MKQNDSPMTEYEKTVHARAERRSGRERFFAAIFLLLVITAVWLIFPADDARAEVVDYETDSYTIRTTVDKDHTMHVRETIKVDFGNNAHHGIYRYIPYDTTQYKVEFRNAGGDEYSEKKTTENAMDFLVVKIGRIDSTVTGKQTYRLNYDLICNADRYSDYDILTYNMFPTGWPSWVKTAKSTLTLPKDIDWDALKTYGGKQGSTGRLPDCFTESVDKDSRTITITGTDVEPNIGATVTAKLEEGYWEDPPNHNGARIPIIIVLVLLPLLAAILWMRHGRDPKVVPTVEFSAPDGCLPCDIGYIMNGEATNEDVLSMIMYYADKGYLALEQRKRNQLFAVRLKDPDKSEPGYSRKLFDQLFRAKDGSQKESVNLRQLPAQFAKTVDDTKAKIEKHYSKKGNEIFDSKAGFCRVLIYVLLFIVTCLVHALGAYYGYRSWNFLGTIAYMVLMVIGVYNLNSAFDKAAGSNRKNTTVRLVLGIIFFLAGVGLSALMLRKSADSVSLALFYIASCAVTMVFSVFMRARTKHGAELKGKLIGFRDFIRTAEYDRLKELSDDDPEYFFHVLPYAYVFGMDKTWAYKFDSIELTQPDWDRSVRTEDREYTPQIC
ncbi:MAG: DUF2207 domain-containing protein, partial [Anaerovoracaceae bacterium]